MKLAVLTTETLHHTRFVASLAEVFDELSVILETRSLKAPFETAHPFEARSDEHEREAWFEGSAPGIAELANTWTTESCNSPAAIRRLQEIGPDAVVVFGTGKLSPRVIAVCPEGMVNLHGGDPERYRGLDTMLWAIYHRDFDALVTTLHRVEARLDAGDIVLRASIPLHRGMALHELRRHNTELCIDLTLSALESFNRRGRYLAHPQRQLGRYYSFMPASLKELCEKRFRRFTAGLQKYASDG